MPNSPKPTAARAAIMFSGTPEERRRLQRIALDNGMKVQRLLQNAVDFYVTRRLKAGPVFSNPAES